MHVVEPPPGPQVELQQLATWAALLPLLPAGSALRVTLLGPDVPRELHGEVLAVREAGAAAACEGGAAGPAEEGGEVEGGGEEAGQQGCWEGYGSAVAEQRPGAKRRRVGVSVGGLSGHAAGLGEADGARLELRLLRCALHEALAAVRTLLGSGEGVGEGQAAGCQGVEGCQGGSGGGGPAGTGRASQTGSPAAEAAHRPLLVFAPNAGEPRAWAQDVSLAPRFTGGFSRAQGVHEVPAHA